MIPRKRGTLLQRAQLEDPPDGSGFDKERVPWYIAPGSGASRLNSTAAYRVFFFLLLFFFSFLFLRAFRIVEKIPSIENFVGCQRPSDSTKSPCRRSIIKILRGISPIGCLTFLLQKSTHIVFHLPFGSSIIIHISVPQKRGGYPCCMGQGV